MLVQIKYPDHSTDYVNSNTLDSLIESKQVAEFKRSTGWVKIGVDPVRLDNQDDAFIYPA